MYLIEGIFEFKSDETGFFIESGPERGWQQRVRISGKPY